ncbi:MAG: ferritin family protein [Zestosphaera sp.]
MSYELIKKAQEIEENAVSSYFHALRILRLQGTELQDLEKVVKKVAIDTLIHRELMKGVLKAYEEAIKKEAEIMKELEEMKPSAKEKAIITKILREHLIIESEMIDNYKKLAQEMPYTVLKELAESLAKNEEEHHKLLISLIKKYEE